MLAGLVLVPEGRMVFPSLTVRREPAAGRDQPARATATAQRSLDHVYHVFPRLLERERQLAVTLSGGEQQMLAIGRGLMAQPKLMLLDEPTLGLAPLIAQPDLRADRAPRAKAGSRSCSPSRTCPKTLAAANHAYVIETGRVAAEGPADTIANDPRIRQAYMGL